MNINLLKNSIIFNWEKDYHLSKLLQSFQNKVEIRFVGGCVRNAFLGQKINEIDFAINIVPSEIIKILNKNNIEYDQQGIKFGTIKAIIKDKNYEITSLRKDTYKNSRFPDVEFINDWQLDSLRRDFTINSIYISLNKEIFDYHDGLNDLRENRILFIGKAKKRIKEDYIRIIRFYRFLSFFEFPKYNLKDLHMLNNVMHKIEDHVSNNKIKSELKKILNNPFPKNSLVSLDQDNIERKNKLIKYIQALWEKDDYKEGLNNCLKKINYLINNLQ